jgi:hypothetical protein
LQQQQQQQQRRLRHSYCSDVAAATRARAFCAAADCDRVPEAGVHWGAPAQCGRQRAQLGDGP